MIFLADMDEWGNSHVSDQTGEDSPILVSWVSEDDDRMARYPWLLNRWQNALGQLPCKREWPLMVAPHLIPKTTSVSQGGFSDRDGAEATAADPWLTPYATITPTAVQSSQISPYTAVHSRTQLSRATERSRDFL